MRERGGEGKLWSFSVSCLSSINLALSGKMMQDDEKFTEGSDSGGTCNFIKGETLQTLDTHRLFGAGVQN